MENNQPKSSFCECGHHAVAHQFVPRFSSIEAHQGRCDICPCKRFHSTPAERKEVTIEDVLERELELSMEKKGGKCPHGCPWPHQPEHWHYKNAERKDVCVSCKKYEPMNTKCLLHRSPAPRPTKKECKCFPLDENTCFFTNIVGGRCDCKCHFAAPRPTESWEDLWIAIKEEIMEEDAWKSGDIVQRLHLLEKESHKIKVQEYDRGYQEASEKAGLHFINEEIPAKIAAERERIREKIEKEIAHNSSFLQKKGDDDFYLGRQHGLNRAKYLLNE